MRKIPSNYVYIKDNKKKTKYYSKFLLFSDKNIKKLYIGNINIPIPECQYEFKDEYNENCILSISGNLIVHTSRDSRSLLNVAKQNFANKSESEVYELVKNFINHNMKNILNNMHQDIKKYTIFNYKNSFMIQLFLSLEELGMRPSTSSTLNFSIQKKNSKPRIIDEYDYTPQQINQILKAFDEGVNLINISPHVPVEMMRIIREKYKDKKQIIDELLLELNSVNFDSKIAPKIYEKILENTT